MILFAVVVRRALVLSGMLLFVLLGPAWGVILYGTDNALANTTAPAGDQTGSGWQHQGLYGSFLGTMISPQHFITAQHIGVSASPTFTSTAGFNGGTDVAFTIDAAANGGTGFWDIAGTDLRIYKVNETFSGHAELYTGSVAAGMELMVFGRGGPRGGEVELEGDLKGWYHTGSDGVPRWGQNQVESIVTYAGASYLRADFDAVAGVNEATLSVGDSGGGVFINDGGVWKLVGINYGTDGFFDINNVTGDGGEFEAALFDRGGFYQGSDGGGWTAAPLPAGLPANFYASYIPASVLEIQSIIGVPEPGPLVLMTAGGLLLLRRRRQGSGFLSSAKISRPAEVGSAPEMTMSTV